MEGYRPWPVGEVAQFPFRLPLMLVLFDEHGEPSLELGVIFRRIRNQFAFGAAFPADLDVASLFLADARPVLVKSLRQIPGDVRAPARAAFGRP